jgi:hypothetical protein
VSWPLERRTPLRRTGIRPMSQERADDAVRRQQVREQLFARDGGCLLIPLQGRPVVAVPRGHMEEATPPDGLRIVKVPFCHGPDTPHHLIKAWKGGSYTLPNLVTLCAGHNVWVEDEPDAARPLGLCVTEGTTLAGAHQLLVHAGLTPGLLR